MTDRRQSELAKYAVVYHDPLYHMHPKRQKLVTSLIAALPYRQSYLDVSCGRGEMLSAAHGLGFSRVTGTEVVPELIRADVLNASPVLGLPFDTGSFDVVTMLDVIEHLLPGDDRVACAELQRVAGRVIFLSANNLPSLHSGWDLHVNKRPHQEWDRLFHEWFTGRVVWLRDKVAKKSQLWRIDIEA